MWMILKTYAKKTVTKTIDYVILFIWNVQIRPIYGDRKYIGGCLETEGLGQLGGDG